MTMSIPVVRRQTPLLGLGDLSCSWEVAPRKLMQKVMPTQSPQVGVIVSQRNDGDSCKSLYRFAFLCKFLMSSKVAFAFKFVWSICR